MHVSIAQHKARPGQSPPRQVGQVGHQWVGWGRSTPGLESGEAYWPDRQLLLLHSLGPLPHPCHLGTTHGKVDAAKQRMDTKPRPTLASSQPSWAHSPNKSHIHWREPLGQLEKLLKPSFFQTMAKEGERQAKALQGEREGVFSLGWSGS